MSKQIGIKEVLDMVIYDFTTGAPLLNIDYATSSTVETTAERLDLRGGQGNYKLLSFDHTKSMTMKAELPIVDMTLLGKLTGKDLNIGAVTVPNKELLFTSASNTITLAATPVTGTLQVYLQAGSSGANQGRDLGTVQTVGTPASTPNTYSISGTTITLNSTTAPQNTGVFVYYDYTAPATTNQIAFTANRFPGYVRITGNGLVTDERTGAVVPTKFDMKKCKAQNNFTLTMASTEATKLEMVFDCYSVDVNNNGAIDKTYGYFSELV